MNLFFFRHSKSFISTFNSSIINRCSREEVISFVTHGWRENQNTLWVNHTIGNLTEIRGGCVIFMDYSYYAQIRNFRKFLRHFTGISAVLERKLRQLENEGFDPNNWYMFGHSVGARLVINACADFGYQKVKEIDGNKYKLGI